MWYSGYRQPDYEGMILARQEQQEIDEDNGVFGDDDEEEIISEWPPIVRRWLKEDGGKQR